MSPLPRRPLFVLVLLLLAAFALRLFRLDYQSIWWDEGISLHLATSSLAEIVRDRLDNIHPPLYFFALKGWVGLAGVSAFSGRYLGALAALLQVPLVFAFTSYLMGRVRPRRSPALAPVAWIAAVLMVIAPLSVIYGQEIRVYAFLPLIFIGLLWLGERMITAGRLDLRHLVLLGAVEWLGLHLHYIAAFGIAYVALWGLSVFARRRRSDLLWRWIGLHAVVAIASLPWFIAVLGNWSAVQAEASAGTFTTDPVPLSFLFAQVWAFQLTGLAGALGTPLVPSLTAVTAAVFVVLVGLRVVRWDRPATILPTGADDALWRQRLRLMVHWSVPLGLALVVWSLRSFSHPRYVTMYTIAFVPLVAVILWPARRWLTQAVAAALAVLLVALSLWGLGRYFFNPGTAKADMRGVAGYLSDTAGAEDIIVIPDTDWSLPFEYAGPATILMADWSGSPLSFPASLDAARGCGPTATVPLDCGDPVDVFAVDYERGTRDWQNRVPFELERRGALVNTVAFDELIVRHYVLDSVAEEIPACAPDDTNAIHFGPLALQGSWVEKGAAADTAVAVALCWQATAEPSDAFQNALTLIDPLTGEQLGQVTSPLLDSQGRPTTAWAVREPIVTYHLLPTVPGSPPLNYELLTSVFSLTEDGVSSVAITSAMGQAGGRQATLDPAALAPPFLVADNPYQVIEPPRFAEAVPLTSGVALAGSVLGGGSYRPGQTVRIGLLWQRDQEPLGDFAPEVRLEQDGRLLAANTDSPVQGRYPAGQWQPGELVREVRDLRLPPEVDGSVDVILQVGSERLPLGTIEIAGGEILQTMPEGAVPVGAVFGEVAELAGYMLDQQTVIVGEEVSLTLIWRSLGDQIGGDYAVFAHLVTAEDNLIGQHDGQPDNGQRPTSDWLEGELIVDPHPIAWRETVNSGTASIRVGLYDPDTGTRLLLPDGTDAFTLPFELPIVPSP